MPNKKVKLNLVGLDGNAFILIGHFCHAASRQGWTPEEISDIKKECMSGDYNHLLSTLSDHCQEED